MRATVTNTLLVKIERKKERRKFKERKKCQKAVERKLKRKRKKKRKIQKISKEKSRRKMKEGTNRLKETKLVSSFIWESGESSESGDIYMRLNKSKKLLTKLNK